MIDMQMRGGALVEKRLLAMEQKTAKKIVKAAIGKGLRPARKAARANAKSMVGGEMGALLAKNIKIKTPKQRRGSHIKKVWIAPGVDEFIHTGKNGTRYYIPAAIEYGHKMPGGGAVPAIPLMRKAADTELKKAGQIMTREIIRGINEVARGG